MPIDPVTAGSLATTASSRTPNAELDKNGFLKLLTEQLRNQDPSSNSDPTQYFQQISMMTMVEQLTNLSEQEGMGRAQSLLGKTVTYRDEHRDSITGQATHEPVTGVVQKVDLSGSTPKLTVEGVGGVDPSWITEVA